MSNDRELLELAAKAAGVPLIEWSDEWLTDDKCPWGPGYLAGYRASSDPLYYWNPLTDDGDALRLATKLGICISFIADGDTVQAFQRNQYAEIHNVKTEAMDDFGVRRAIVRAAAEIGRSMP